MIIQFIILLGLCVVIYLQLAEKGVLDSLKRSSRRRIILDSCALIDARIVELVRTHFITDELIIPKFILRELQQLADGSDSHKRERARFGLETAITLQELTKVTIDETDYAQTLPTDDKLMILSKDRKAVLCTTDYNLNKVASVEGIIVLNVNDLSQSLRPISLPGEKHTVKIVQKGSNKNQGVGYLDDGTMIVVDNGAKYIGKSVNVVMDHMLQTVAGKMAFAKLLTTSNASSSDEQPQRHVGQTTARQSAAPATASSSQQPRRRESTPRLQTTQHATITPPRRQPGKLSRDQLEKTLLNRLNGAGTNQSAVSAPRPARRPRSL